VRRGSLEDVPLDGPRPDVVTLWNVLEHLADPLAFLREIEQRLAADGVLCLAVPVNDSWEARLFGPYWVGWELPRHLYGFDQRSVARLLAAAGFTIVQQACVSGIYHGLVRSVMLALEPRVRSYALLRVAERMLLSQPLRVVFKPYMLLAERARRGTVLTIAARRIHEVAG
jgi:SAM-dependent methyltransferase